MIKIKSPYLSAALISFILLASIDVVLMKGSADFTLYIIYSVILSMAGYVLNDARAARQEIAGLLFVLLAAVFVSAGQYVFSFHHIPHLWLAFVFMAAAFAALCAERFFAEKGNREKGAGIQRGGRRPASGNTGFCHVPQAV